MPKRRPVLLPALLLTLASLSCGPASQGEGVPPPGHRPALMQPEVLQQVDPDFTEATAKFLDTSNVKLRVVFHIAVRRDGTASAVKVVSAEPAELPAARTFAEEVAASIPKWRFRPATVNGAPVDAEFNFLLETQGAGGEGQAPGR